MAKAKRMIFNKKEKAPSVIFLYLFLIPMFASTIVSLFNSDYSSMVLKLIAFAMLYGSINLINRGLLEEYNYNKAKIAKAPKYKFKTLGAIGLGVTTLFLSLMVDHLSLINSIALPILATAGSLIYYGKDPSRDKIPENSGVNYEKLLAELSQAEDKIKAIENTKDKIEDLELKDAIDKATIKAKDILKTIEDDPKDIRVARKFMVVYLDGIKDVVDKYNSIEGHDLDDSYRIRLVELLNDASNRFNKELDRLKSNEIFDLDVQIDSLKQQLKN